jgi:hypothetical protein
VVDEARKNGVARNKAKTEMRMGWQMAIEVVLIVVATIY